MTPQSAAWLLLAHMALADGEITEEERAMLSDVVALGGPWGDVDALLAEAGGTDVDTLLGAIDRYADGFFIATRVYLMARIDGEVDPAEQALYERLVGAFDLTEEDQALIAGLGAEMEAGPGLAGPGEPPARVAALYAESSFAQEG